MDKNKYLEKYINDYQQLDKQKLSQWDDDYKNFFPDKQKYMPEFGDIDLDKYYSKYIKKQNLDSLYDPPDEIVKKEIKKDQQNQGVTPHQFKVGDLVRANANHPGLDNNHPDWSEARLNLLGGIIISAEDLCDGGVWSVPFYQVLWPNGVVETVAHNWIESYV